VPLRVAQGNLQQLLPGLNLHGCRVLLAEDHEVNQRLVSKLLQHVGVQVEVVENGQLAVERVREEDYDLVLMDMQMPVLDGGGATLAIRALGPRGQLPIIAISASAMPEDRQRCRELGMNGFLAKPLKVEQLYATLRHWFTRQPDAAPALTPPAAAQTATALPSIAELETREGLQRVLGDHALYLDLLRRLVVSEQDTPGNIRQALARGDGLTAQRLAHTLKGLAGTVGANAVMACAAELERAIHDCLPAAATEQALVQLETRLNPLLAALQQFLGSVPTRQAVAVDPVQLAQICHKLASLLNEDDAEAASWFNEQSGLLRAAFPDDYPQLEGAIRRFEFGKALATLQTLMTLQQPEPTRSRNA
jgi:two-component system sensor histidine kinase/response regulator